MQIHNHSLAHTFAMAQCVGLPLLVLDVRFYSSFPALSHSSIMSQTCSTISCIVLLSSSTSGTASVSTLGPRVFFSLPWRFSRSPSGVTIVPLHLARHPGCLRPSPCPPTCAPLCQLAFCAAWVLSYVVVVPRLCVSLWLMYCLALRIQHHALANAIYGLKLQGVRGGWCVCGSARGVHASTSTTCSPCRPMWVPGGSPGLVLPAPRMYPSLVSRVGLHPPPPLASHPPTHDRLFINQSRGRKHIQQHRAGLHQGNSVLEP